MLQGSRAMPRLYMRRLYHSLAGALKSRDVIVRQPPDLVSSLPELTTGFSSFAKKNKTNRKKRRQRKNKSIKLFSSCKNIWGREAVDISRKRTLTTHCTVSRVNDTMQVCTARCRSWDRSNAMSETTIMHPEFSEKSLLIDWARQCFTSMAGPFSTPWETHCSSLKERRQWMTINAEELDSKERIFNQK